MNIVRKVARYILTSGNKSSKEKDSNKHIWIDVGAHLGEDSIGFAKDYPGAVVYAFEPMINLAIPQVGILPNYFILPMAVSEQDGSADFYVNVLDEASSLLPINSKGAEQWIGGKGLSVERKITVPTIRLDTFLNLAKISHVDYLKIDTQGYDLSVVKSAGNRIKDIYQITLEVITTPYELYTGQSTKDDTIKYLKSKGYLLTDIETGIARGQAENLNFTRKEDGK